MSNSQDNSELLEGNIDVKNLKSLSVDELNEILKYWPKLDELPEEIQTNTIYRLYLNQETCVSHYRQRVLDNNRLSHDELLNVLILTRELSDFIKIFNVAPRLNLVLMHDATYELFGYLLVKTASVVPLYYNTTFDIGDYYLLILTYANTLFVEKPIIPLAVLLHETKEQECHDELIKTLHKYKQIETKCVLITKDMKKWLRTNFNILHRGIANQATETSTSATTTSITTLLVSQSVTTTTSAPTNKTANDLYKEAKDKFVKQRLDDVQLSFKNWIKSSSLSTIVIDDTGKKLQPYKILDKFKQHIENAPSTSSNQTSYSTAATTPTTTFLGSIAVDNNEEASNTNLLSPQLTTANDRTTAPSSSFTTTTTTNLSNTPSTTVTRKSLTPVAKSAIYYGHAIITTRHNIYNIYASPGAIGLRLSCHSSYFAFGISAVDVEDSKLKSVDVDVYAIVIVDGDEKEIVELLLVEEESELINKRVELFFDLDERECREKSVKTFLDFKFVFDRKDRFIDHGVIIKSMG
ncbi:unnamed protein product [Didymodactylos carnosus]|uniref:Uncharacterized protein n=1 Tax=Didymodactylos carnosus TaxID=1234261 RepID=A0A814RVF8_9BILA|nr:unnamed protein product [Didymodactylos carnosus]CAF1137923.1 unnamed protein product [Didymodactylos carnosus]CAF3749304.1 unnamed protein product [Didymodactylos carnosus]CAF3901675.1 unnamed protein product [Didymodactylos carnosus]